MGRNIPLSVSQAWFTAFFYWTPLLGTLCSAVFLHCFFLATYNVLHIQRALAGGPQRVMSCASGEALAVKVVPPGSSENVLHILFFFQGGFEGELI